MDRRLSLRPAESHHTVRSQPGADALVDASLPTSFPSRSRAAPPTFHSSAPFPARPRAKSRRNSTRFTPKSFPLLPNQCLARQIEGQKPQILAKLSVPKP